MFFNRCKMNKALYTLSKYYFQLFYRALWILIFIYPSCETFYQRDLLGDLVNLITQFHTYFYVHNTNNFNRKSLFQIFTYVSLFIKN